jgi:uncharacterized cofD-like protein
MAAVPLDIEATVQVDAGTATDRAPPGDTTGAPIGGADQASSPGSDQTGIHQPPGTGHQPDRAGGAGEAVVRGQEAVARSPWPVQEIRLIPPAPPACTEALEAVTSADWVFLGPGSWFTSVLPHLLVPDLRKALVETEARRGVVLNLAPQPGETAGFSPAAHLDVLHHHAPELRIDAVVADDAAVTDIPGLRAAAGRLGARVVLAPVAVGDGTPRHDPVLLARAYRAVLSGTI